MDIQATREDSRGSSLLISHHYRTYLLPYRCRVKLIPYRCREIASRGVPKNNSNKIVTSKKLTQTTKKNRTPTSHNPTPTTITFTCFPHIYIPKSIFFFYVCIINKQPRRNLTACYLMKKS